MANYSEINPIFTILAACSYIHYHFFTYEHYFFRLEVEILKKSRYATKARHAQSRHLEMNNDLRRHQPIEQFVKRGAGRVRRFWYHLDAERLAIILGLVLNHLTWEDCYCNYNYQNRRIQD